MPDPIITAVAAYLGVQSFEALVKPSLALAGDEAKKFLEQRFRRISGSAERKLGSRLDTDGAVNPRLFKKIIDDGCLCNDSLSADYYGGFLASSRTKDGMDDANIPFVSMVNRMSADQLHGHWILYSLLFNQLHGQDFALHLREERKRAALYISWKTFIFLFAELRTDYIDDSEPKFKFAGADRHHSVTVDPRLLQTYGNGWKDFSRRRLDLVFWGLISDDLVEHLYWGLTGHDLAYGMIKDFPNDPLRIAPKKFGEEEIAHVMSGGTFTDGTSMAQGGVVFQPSILGMDLFLRAQGLPPEDMITFKSLRYDFCPKEFAEEILKGVHIVASGPPNCSEPAGFGLGWTI